MEAIPRSGSLSLAHSGLTFWHAFGVGARSPKGCPDISQEWSEATLLE